MESRRSGIVKSVVGEAKTAIDALRTTLEAGLELEDSPAALVGSLFLIRCVRNLAAVVTLCEAGWAPEAQTLLRAMVEDMVTIGYISTDTTLAAKWLSFENRRLPDGEDVLAALNGRERPERDVPKYERWTRLSFNTMAEKADAVVPGLTDYLGYVYPILSDRAHGNTSASSVYVRVTPDGHLQPNYAPSDDQVAVTLCNAVTAAFTTAERARSLGVRVDIAPLEESERRAYAACGMPTVGSTDTGA